MGHPTKKQNALERVSHFLNDKMELFFGHCGFFVASHPFATLLISLTFVGISIREHLLIPNPSSPPLTPSTPSRRRLLLLFHDD